MPKKVESLSGIVQISAGADFTICIDKDGTVYSFGKNMYGQLGLQGSNILLTNTPTKLKLDTGSKAVQISCGEEHASLLTTDN